MFGAISDFSVFVIILFVLAIIFITLAVKTVSQGMNFTLERFEESAEWARRASRSQNPRYWVDAMLVAALQKLGDTAGVEAAKRTLLERRPDYRLPKESPLGPEYLEALREAGLPE